MGESIQDWFDNEEWWHQSTMEEACSRLREFAEMNHLSEQIVVEVLKIIEPALRNEYGD